MVQTAADHQTERGHQRKREILAGASRVFRRQGLHGTGMRDIAAELGMAVGNLYYYFRDKQQLLAFCQQESLAGLLALARRVEKSGGGPPERLYRLIVGHLRLLHEETPGSLAHLDVEALDGAARQQVQPLRDEYEAALRQLIRAGVEQGVFRPVDAKLASFAILGALNWTAQWYRPGGEASPRQLGREFAGLLVRGLLPDGAPFGEPALDQEIEP
ncbi:MAG TPA: TetR/AcrR family transcriptional regulator [Thermoanaerobaculia bacterium]|nr:TetR/AcrR family transcriptional regulator [Thermoanaerobaculia bacterium]